MSQKQTHKFKDQRIQILESFLRADGKTASALQTYSASTIVEKAIFGYFLKHIP
jgi:hypothetical protein